MLSSVLCREHIARTDNGNLDGVGHLIDDRPIGLARIELRGAATMYRHRGGPCSLKHLGKRRGVAVFGVKALRIFTVTGTCAAPTAASTICSARSGVRISAEPRPW